MKKRSRIVTWLARKMDISRCEVKDLLGVIAIGLFLAFLLKLLG